MFTFPDLYARSGATSNAARSDLNRYMRLITALLPIQAPTTCANYKANLSNTVKPYQCLCGLQRFCYSVLLDTFQGNIVIITYGYKE